MGSLWRSEEMSLAQLFIQSEAAYECVNALGELGLVQFFDLNEEAENMAADTDRQKERNEDGTKKEVLTFKRRYTNEVRRCDEMMRKLRYFEKEILKNDIPIDGPGAALAAPAPDNTEMQQMEMEFERLERELKEINQNAEALMKQEAELTEMKHILTKTSTFFDEADAAQSIGELPTGAKQPLMSDSRGKLGFIAGVIVREKAVSFERLMWRACRGNVFMRRVALEDKLMDAHKGEKVLKDVFIVFYQGSQLETRVRKICEGFQTTLYPCPDNNVERREMCVEVDTRLADLQNVLNTTKDHLRTNLGRTAFQLAGWQVKVTKIKAIYHTMNKFNFDAARKSLLGECWVPQDQLPAIREALKVGAERSGTGAQPILTPKKTKKKPPTYNVVNKFTSAFQAIIDAYGVATYQEVNPGPFTIITFPFLFAVMFGDLGHGFIMFLFAAYLCYKEQALSSIKSGGEIWDTIFGGRYIVLLMGMFSMYTGFIYNDLFSKSITLVESGWVLPEIENIHEDLFKVSHERFEKAEDGYCEEFGCFKYAYPFGVDPIWNLAENKLTFTNSFKMKLSVILGVMQMGFGVCLSYFNGRYFKKPLDVYHMFLPQIIFLMSIFGYLCVMIVYKWCTAEFPQGQPPSLLLMLINMFLKLGSPIEDGEVLYGGTDGKTQQGFQTILVALALVCVPWMLAVKPYFLGKQIKRDAERRAAQGANDEEEEEEDDEHHNFGEIMVHQAIHTIEFCLGCISNTASYLRLWALSLAHAELSEVLWEMILDNCFHAAGGPLGPVMLFCGFTVWAILTVAVLLIMEGLSAFLHALRLHWVEFNNKFYDGTGYLFRPFSFHLILEGEDEDFI
eukprot:m.332133 g.332133  ORF g.332133 m.332133 type:complete len:848 (+) comp16883_c0_seq1:89-2632(+)